jgi:hypothetical protein
LTDLISQIYSEVKIEAKITESGPQGEKGDKGDTGDQGIQGIQGIQGEQGIQGVKGDKGDTGIAGLTWRGAYAAGTAYSVRDAVSYNGSSYYCIQASTGNAPTNTTYWAVLAIKGADGAGTGDMSKSTYDTDDDGVVDNAMALNSKADTDFASATSLTSHIADYIRQPAYGTTGGSANLYTLSTTPALDIGMEDFEGVSAYVKIHATNTGASTINWDGLGAVIVDSKGQALTAGKLTAGRIYGLRHNGTNFQLLNEGGDEVLIDASNVKLGVAYTDSEGAKTGTYNTMQVTVGDRLLINNTMPTSSGFTTYTLVTGYTYTMPFAGSVRVKFIMANDTVSSKGRVYINGVAVGMERTNSTGSAVTYTEEFNVQAGDAIAIYAKVSSAGYYANFSSFTIGCAEIGITNVASVTKIVKY